MFTISHMNFFFFNPSNPGQIKKKEKKQMDSHSIDKVIDLNYCAYFKKCSLFITNKMINE